MIFHIFQLTFEPADSLPDPSPVHFQLFLPGTSCTDPASQTGQRPSQARQTGRPVAQLRQLYLKLALSGYGPPGKYIQNQQCPVQYLAV